MKLGLRHRNSLNGIQPSSTLYNLSQTLAWSVKMSAREDRLKTQAPTV